MYPAAMSSWQPPSSLEERLLGALVPARLHYWARARRQWRRGEGELRLLPELMDPARNSVDVGANKGVYTYWMARHSRHVFAYEPNPKMFRILNAGAGRNVTVSPAALSDNTGESVLRVPRTASGYSNQGASLNYRKVGDDYGEVTIETRRLDDEALTDIGFMKIDVEGHELAVLEGGRDLIARDRPVLLIEMEEAHTKQPIEESLGAVLALDYDGFFLCRGELTSLDNFDGNAHHRAAPMAADYTFNFIFKPRS
jgi:FkbM family methyltransferase